MPVVKMDEKGRIQIPQKVRESLKLKAKQSLIVEMREDSLVVRKTGKVDPETDPLLRDILINPAHSKVKVTRKLLRKLEDEAWTP